MGRPSKYPAEFRREAVELVRSSKWPVAEVARSLNMNSQRLGNWIRVEREAAERDGDLEALTESKHQELKRLRKENAQLTRRTQYTSLEFTNRLHDWGLIGPRPRRGLR